MSIDHFHGFAKMVNNRLVEFSKHELFRVQAPEDIFASYLKAFPEGTNEMFRQRTVHDCSCCKNFIRNMGTLVSIEHGVVESLWAISGLEEPYATVAKAMNDLIIQQPIVGPFRTKEGSYGAQLTHDPKTNERWNHFWGKVEGRFRCDDPAAQIGTLNTEFETSKRGLTELTHAAVQTVLDMIKEGQLYRGEEHLRQVTAFQTYQRAFQAAGMTDIFVRKNLNKGMALFRNSVIGTLIQDLSNGVPIEDAVKMFESKVAPHNYKRPKALVTAKMIDEALAVVATMGLENALERRHAKISDISVNDVLFVNHAVRHQMRDGLREKLMASAVSKAPNHAAGRPIMIAEFMDKVMPNVVGLKVLAENKDLGHFMSLTAPVHETPGKLFAWGNNFAWSYEGEVADSIKERVKRAGGNTGAALRVSLAWTNYDDLDLHCICPDGHVFYAAPGGDAYLRTHSRILDVDMNAGHGDTRTPVENLSWVKPKNGRYTIKVNQFNRRERVDGGFTMEIESQGKIEQFTFKRDVLDRETVECFEFSIENGMLKDFKMLDKELVGGLQPKDHWGIKTQTLVPVSVLMKSPNHWDGVTPTGNRHWFFILKGCKNPDPVRGIYNEFLRGDLQPHRRVFELLGSKTKCPYSDEQLSGLGFSEGRDEWLLIEAETTMSKMLYNVKF